MDEDKARYYENYKKEKQKGLKFWPDIIFKDLIVSFALFLLLVGLAVFVGVAHEPPADPNDAAYVPRPEWYFLFLFQMLKYFPEMGIKPFVLTVDPSMASYPLMDSSLEKDIHREVEVIKTPTREFYNAYHPGYAIFQPQFQESSRAGACLAFQNRP